MKPVNFLSESNKQVKSIKKSLDKKSLLKLIPFIVLICIIINDFYKLEQQLINFNTNPEVDDKIISELESRIEELESNYIKYSNIESDINNLKTIKNCNKDFIETLENIIYLENNNSFINFIEYNKNIYISGVSLKKEFINDWINKLNTGNKVYKLQEVNFHEGHYTFSIYEGDKLYE